MYNNIKQRKGKNNIYHLNFFLVKYIPIFLMILRKLESTFFIEFNLKKLGVRLVEWNTCMPSNQASAGSRPNSSNSTWVKLWRNIEFFLMSFNSLKREEKFLVMNFSVYLSGLFIRIRCHQKSQIGKFVNRPIWGFIERLKLWAEIWQTSLC